MWISVDPADSLPLTRQLYQKMKAMILEGTLTPGEKLPSSRTLARDLSISRNTVLEVYNQLIAEGYLEGFHGSGTVVADGILKKYQNYTKISVPVSSVPVMEDSKLIDFRSGVPALELFPYKEWGKLYYQICSELPSGSLRYLKPEGSQELRAAISQYLYRTRGIQCSEEQIMIISGSTQGLSLISKLLYREPLGVITENPTHPGLCKVITSAGYQITGIPVDEKGILTKELTPSEQVAFIYATPSHQYPMGGILPVQRRIELIQYALDNNCYILEDDYDSEFRYEGPPVSSLYELNPEKVIYIGSFSKILAPALRLGFLLLPRELIAPYRQLKMYSDVHSEAVTQYTLAKFIREGCLEKHIWKTKKLYQKKRDYLLLQLKNHWKDEYEVKGQAAGLHIVVCFPGITFTKELTAKLLFNHVKIYPLRHYYLEEAEDDQHDILLGYAHLSFEEISEGIETLRRICCDTQ
ncbi:MAG TPA: PLP-dependent aminotransferase family protein [Mobilitalea sp.]|nr:PLP-dependent aminotransferase family protein [Mobilitalea sp.]